MPGFVFWFQRHVSQPHSRLGATSDLHSLDLVVSLMLLNSLYLVVILIALQSQYLVINLMLLYRLTIAVVPVASQMWVCDAGICHTPAISGKDGSRRPKPVHLCDLHCIQTDFFFAMPVDFNFSSAGLCPAWTRGVCQFVCDLLPFAVAACHQVNIPRIKCKLQMDLPPTVKFKLHIEFSPIIKCKLRKDLPPMETELLWLQRVSHMFSRNMLNSIQTA